MATQRTERQDHEGNEDEMYTLRTDPGAPQTVEDFMRGYLRGTALELAETALRVLEETTHEAAIDATKDVAPDLAERALKAAEEAWSAAKDAWGPERNEVLRQALRGDG